MKLATYLVLLDVVGSGCGALCEGYCSTSRVNKGGGLIAIWSRGLGSPGFCSETSLPDL